MFEGQYRGFRWRAEHDALYILSADPKIGVLHRELWRGAAPNEQAEAERLARGYIDRECEALTAAERIADRGSG